MSYFSLKAQQALAGTNNWDEFFHFCCRLPSKSNDGLNKGDLFELLSYRVLTRHPEYSQVANNVWHHSEIPVNVKDALGLPNSDEGIDLLLETKSSDYWSIQCKFRSDVGRAVTRKELSTFAHLSFNVANGISFGLVLHSADRSIKKSHLLPDIGELGIQFFQRINKEEWRNIVSLNTDHIDPRSPREHQKEAVDSVVETLESNAPRSKVIMPCGTGKSLTAYWLDQRLQSKLTVVAVPSLYLISQCLKDWSREEFANKNPTQFLVICSDTSVGRSADEFVDSTSELGLPVTTDTHQIAKFLSIQNQKKVVFVTYHSGPTLCRAAELANIEFDLAIFDEAHRTVGSKEGVFGSLLLDENFACKKRVFMTATERVIPTFGQDIISMDDPSLYGSIAYQMSFKRAIHGNPPIITDYKIVTIAITDNEIEEFLDSESDVTASIKERSTSVQDLVTAIAINRLIREKKVSHIISFHKSIGNAQSFAEVQSELFGLDEIEGFASSVSSKLPTHERNKRLAEFESASRAVICNARCLQEGIDIPIVDAVVFADPKHSLVDIVQASGRALRRYEGKTKGYIVIPVRVPTDQDFDEYLDSTDFKSIGRIVSALSTQDERLVEELRRSHSTDQGQDSDGNEPIFEFLSSNELGSTIHTHDLLNHIQNQYWKSVARSSWRPYEEAKAYVHTLKLSGQSAWHKFHKTGKLPLDIPKAPQKTYAFSGWDSWGEWLGNGQIHGKYREYLPYEEARDFVHSLGLKTQAEWRDYSKSGSKPLNIPGNPNKIYENDGWTGTGDWLGTGKTRNYYDYYEAREVVRKLELTSNSQFQNWLKSDERDMRVPTNPQQVYEKNWIGIHDFLGCQNRRVWCSLEEASRYAQSLKLKGKDHWYDYHRTNDRPLDVPANPNTVYKNKGWNGWGPFLGSGIKKEFLSFEDARSFSRNLGLKSISEWRQYAKSEKRPSDMVPASPWKTFKDQYINIADWLGIPDVSTLDRGYRPFKDARAFVRSLELRSVKEWRTYSKSGDRPLDIPSAPDSKYKGEWQGWKDWLGY